MEIPVYLSSYPSNTRRVIRVGNEQESYSRFEMILENPPFMCSISHIPCFPRQGNFTILGWIEFPSEGSRDQHASDPPIIKFPWSVFLDQQKIRSLDLKREIWDICTIKIHELLLEKSLCNLGWDPIYLAIVPYVFEISFDFSFQVLTRRCDMSLLNLKGITGVMRWFWGVWNGYILVGKWMNAI